MTTAVSALSPQAPALAPDLFAGEMGGVAKSYTAAAIMAELAGHTDAHAHLSGLAVATYDARFNPPKPATGTLNGKAFTFAYNVDGTLTSSAIVTATGIVTKNVIYNVDGSVASYN